MTHRKSRGARKQAFEACRAQSQAYDKQNVIYKFETSMHAPFYVAQKDVRLCGAKVSVDAETGKALSIERVELVDDAESS